MTDEQRAETIAGLRQLATFLENHPAVPMPVCYGLNAFATTKAELVAAARVTGWTKTYRDTWFALSREFPGGVTLDVNIERETICRKVVTGRRTIPAPPAREVEDYHWECEDVALLADR